MKKVLPVSDSLKSKGFLTFKVVFFFLLLICFTNSSAQLFYNNGALIFADKGSTVYVDGDVENATSGDLVVDGIITINNNIQNDAGSTVEGDGQYLLYGNWINNGFFLPDTNLVSLLGINQLITGTEVTHFYDLNCAGTGIKTQTITAYAEHTLNLNDRELATGLNYMMVSNPNINAISRTTGFVSSYGTGYLGRATDVISPYLFPTGSDSIPARYRPVEITPTTTVPDSFTVCFVNNDASNDGYNRALLDDSTICQLNPNFFHKIQRSSGVNPASIAIYYDAIADGIYYGMGQWKPVPIPEWYLASPTARNLTVPLNNVTLESYNDFSSEPFILANIVPQQPDINGKSILCANTDSNVVYFVDSLQGVNYSWSITGGTIVSGNNSDSITVDWTGGAGTLTITESSVTGCVGPASAPFNVVINPAPTAAFTSNYTTPIFAGDVINFIDQSKGANSWLWWFGDSSSSAFEYPTHEWAQPGDYPVTLIVTNSFGCSDTAVYDFIDVIEGVIVQNVFTPNGDGYNDFFVVKGSGLDLFTMNIYDRWGLLVFQSTSKNISWDGKDQAGNDVAEGTYYYILTAQAISGRDFSQRGSLTLLRNTQ